MRPVLTECNVSSEHKDETLGLSSDAISGLKQLLFDLGAKAAKPIYTDEVHKLEDHNNVPTKTCRFVHAF